MLSLLVIGGGNMGGAIVRGVIGTRALQPREVGVVEIDDDLRIALASETGCQAFTYAGHAREEMEVRPDAQIMLAIKPQVFSEMSQMLHDARLAGPSGRVFISIMAGLSSKSLHHALGAGARIIRCMPNIPCQLGLGMTAIAHGMGAKEGDEDRAREIFEAMGETVMVDESLLDAVTAVSGSGPAYVYLLAEAMQKAAEGLNIPPAVARVLATQTIIGAAGMLDENAGDAAALREAVTSPGGTTDAALQVFERKKFERIVAQAIAAAAHRAGKLDA